MSCHNKKKQYSDVYVPQTEIISGTASPEHLRIFPPFSQYILPLANNDSLSLYVLILPAFLELRLQIRSVRGWLGHPTYKVALKTCKDIS